MIEYINQQELKVKFGFNQLVSTELEMLLPSTIFGRMT